MIDLGIEWTKRVDGFFVLDPGWWVGFKAFEWDGHCYRQQWFFYDADHQVRPGKVEQEPSWPV